MTDKTVDEVFELKRGALIHHVLILLSAMEWHLDTQNAFRSHRWEPILGNEKLHELNKFEYQAKRLFRDFEKALLDEAIKLEDNFFFPGIAPETYK